MGSTCCGSRHSPNGERRGKHYLGLEVDPEPLEPVPGGLGIALAFG